MLNFKLFDKYAKDYQRLHDSIVADYKSGAIGREFLAAVSDLKVADTDFEDSDDALIFYFGTRPRIYAGFDLFETFIGFSDDTAKRAIPDILLAHADEETYRKIMGVKNLSVYADRFFARGKSALYAAAASVVNALAGGAVQLETHRDACRLFLRGETLAEHRWKEKYARSPKTESAPVTFEK